MNRSWDFRDGEPTRPVLTGPAEADDAIVFEVRDGEAAREAYEGFAADSEVGGALSRVLKYAEVCDRKGAALTPLYEEHAIQVQKGRGTAWKLASPRQGREKANLGGLHHLKLADPSDGERILSDLKADPRIILPHRPAVQYPLDAPRDGFAEFVARAKYGIQALLHGFASLLMDEDEKEQWWLQRCGFPHAWDPLDKGPVPGVIAVIDQGGDMGHPELQGRIVTMQVPGCRREPSQSDHATAVAGVISARREPRTGISGCCSAQLHLYNVWADDGFDSLGYYNALKDVEKNAVKDGTPSESGVRVVNLSMGSRIDDPTIRMQIQKCLDAGLIIVAAAGNDERTRHDPDYPAAYDGVIGVGATSPNPSDRKMDWSAKGVISAPGARIRTARGSDRVGDRNGTSFAAPMVSAAIWLALRKNPSLDRGGIVELLKSSVATRRPDLGFGRLHMPALMKALGP